MSTVISSETTLAVSDRLKQEGEITCWKVLEVDYSPYWKKRLMSPCEFHIWQPGPNRSNRSDVSLSQYEFKYEMVIYGIHVYLQEELAHADCVARNNHKYIDPRDVREYCVVQVRCRREHFVAAGQGEAVFMEVTLPEAEYARIMGGAA